MTITETIIISNDATWEMYGNITWEELNNYGN